MVDPLVKKLQGLLPEIKQRRDWCFFPERCYESSDTPSLSGAPGTGIFSNGVELFSEIRGVVKLTYLLDHQVPKLGKDSKKVIQEAFQDLDPDLRLVACWTGRGNTLGNALGNTLKGMTWSYEWTVSLKNYLTVYLQYSPVKK